MDLLWNLLHCGWSHIRNVGPLMVPEINLWHDLPASMREILTGSVRSIISKSQMQIFTYRGCINKSRAIPNSTDSTIMVVRV